MLLTRIWAFGVRTKKIKSDQFDFLDLIKPPTGSQISITSQQKQRINKQIDKKMQQLQDTGLSRQQILLSKSQKGLPLAIDPFFQYLKRNKIAREVYLRKNDRFSLEKVIDIALRQDIGPDPSYSRVRDSTKVNQKGAAQLMNDLQQREASYFNPSSYFANQHTTIPKLYEQLKPHQPLRHIFKPINRYQRVKTHQRRLKKYDIHWRNVELLRQFLTPFGNIKSRWANRLSSSDQKKIKMAIKAARHNCAIPHYGKILNPNKKNITSLQQQVKQIGLQNINLQTGQIYYSRPRSMDSIQVQKQKKSDADWKYQQMIKGESFQLWIDTPEVKPNDQVINAERYARHLKNKQNQAKGSDQKKINLRKLALKQIIGDLEKQQEVLANQSPQAKSSFENRKKLVKKRLKQNPLSFSQIILEEKTLL